VNKTFGGIALKKNKKHRHGIISKISEASDLPLDMIGRLPMINLYSNREMYVEDAGVLEHYDSECVRLTQRKNVISVSGRNLELKCLADNNIRVSGFILSVSFEAKERE